ncbi:MAG: hypothetical protein ACRDQ4_13450 [Pseudonocardiaceae bacterium]
MDTILFMTAGVTGSFFVGVLVGSGLHTMSIDRQYQRLAKLVRYHNELDATRDKKSEEHSRPSIFGVR